MANRNQPSHGSMVAGFIAVIAAMAVVGTMDYQYEVAKNREAQEQHVKPCDATASGLRQPGDRGMMVSLPDENGYFKYEECVRNR